MGSSRMVGSNMSICNCTGECRWGGGCPAQLAGSHYFRGFHKFEPNLPSEGFKVNDIPGSGIKRPYRCPICDGTGFKIIQGTLHREVCHACEKGILWG